MRIDYNPLTGLMEGNNTSFDSINTVVQTTLFDTMDSGTCVALSEYSAFRINSKYNNNLINRQKPYVDGILLLGGRAGTNAEIAILKGFKYSFADPILKTNLLTNTLYLSQSGGLTLVEPTLNNGDRWLVMVGTRVNDYEFIFNPQDPRDLLNTTPISPDNASETILLGENMPALCCFKIGPDGSAYKVTNNDSFFPFVDGITLESGIVNQQILVGRIRHKVYNTTLFFNSTQIYYLSSLGTLITTRDNTGLYQVIVGRSQANSSNFVFDPQTPIKIN